MSIYNYVTLPHSSTEPAVTFEADPLPSWRPSPRKAAITAFVADVTDPASPRYVAPEERIAVFDADGTLWPEQPVIELQFALTRAAALIKAQPHLAENPVFQELLATDLCAPLPKNTARQVELVIRSYADMSQEGFAASVRQFLFTQCHQRLEVPLHDAAYIPMRELLAFLRRRGFSTWICTGATTDFARQLGELGYGVPRHQVIGSAIGLELRESEDGVALWHIPSVHRINGTRMKPGLISTHIGRVPLMAVGNVGNGGDIPMLRYCQSRPGASFQLLIHHDDAERELAYDEPDHASLLMARQCGWVVTSMRDDWSRVFCVEQPVAMAD